jgi:tRNA-dihydrouridine synthase
VEEHHAAALSFYGRDLGTRVVRKHLGWYLDAAGAPRRAALTADDPAAVVRHLRAALADAPVAEAA